MLRFDILPRLIPDAHYDNSDEAFEEAGRRKTLPIASDAITRVEPSPYGGYRVYTVSLSLAMEVFTDLAEAGATPPAAGVQGSGYGRSADGR